MNKAILLLFFCISINASAQKNSAAKESEFGIKSIVKSFFQEEKTIWTTPFKLKKSDFNYIFPAVAGLGVVYTLDEPLHREISYLNNHEKAVKSMNQGTTYLGDGALNIGISSLFVLNGILFKNQKSIETGYLSSKAIVHAGVVVFVLKTIAGRERPLTNDHQGNFHFFTKLEAGSAYHSFPSGHTITAFSMATVIAKEFNNKRWVGATAYGLASLVGLSRIGLSKHWASDVFTGAVLGYTIGNFTYHFNEKKRSRKVTFN